MVNLPGNFRSFVEKNKHWLHARPDGRKPVPIEERRVSRSREQFVNVMRALGAPKGSFEGKVQEHSPGVFGLSQEEFSALSVDMADFKESNADGVSPGPGN